MGIVLVITNRKGGCGKSFTTASLGVGLARQGKKVLCIDADNQHSLTVSLGIAEPENLEITLATVIADIIAKKEIDPTAGIIHHAEGIDLLPSNNSLTGIELTLAPMIGREIILRKYLGKVKSLYDYCLIDTAPTLKSQRLSTPSKPTICAPRILPLLFSNKTFADMGLEPG